MAKYDSDLSSIPYRYRPLGAWAYFGYTLLFTIPIVGFILMIVFACSNENYNRRNFARSYFCSLIIIGAIVLTILLVVGVIGGSSASNYSSYYY